MTENTTEIADQTEIAYSIDEISTLTSLSKPFLRGEIKANRLKAKKFGRRVLVMSEDLITYLQKGSVGRAASN
jgi:excisionase family DNA binding protein